MVGAFYFWTAGTSARPGPQLPLAARRGLRGRRRPACRSSRAPELLALARPVRPGPERARTGSTTRPSTRAGTTSTSAPRRRRCSSSRSGPSASTSSDRAAAPLRPRRLPLRAAPAAVPDRPLPCPAPPTAWRPGRGRALGLGNVVPSCCAGPRSTRWRSRPACFFLMAAALYWSSGPCASGPRLPLIGAGSLALGLAWARARTWPWPRRCWSGRGGGPPGPRAGWRRGPRAARRRPPRRRALRRLPAAARRSTTSCASARRPSSASATSSPASTRATFDFFSLDRLRARRLVLPAPAAAFGLDFPFITPRPELPGTLPDGLLRRAGGRGAPGDAAAAGPRGACRSWRCAGATRRPVLGEVAALVRRGRGRCCCPCPSLVSFGGRDRAVRG